MSHQNSWFHTLPSICLSWVQTCDIIEGRYLPRTVLMSIWLGARKGKVFYDNHFLLSSYNAYRPEWNFMSPIPLRGSTVLLIKHSSHFKRCASYPDVDVYLSWWKLASKGRRKEKTGKSLLSSFSFPLSLALRHQSLDCHSRFALASARETKCLRRRQKRCC